MGEVLGLIEVDIESEVPRGRTKWLEEYEELRAELARHLAPVDPNALQRGELQEGEKGFALIPIAIALGKAGVFTALGGAFKAWLQARGNRKVRVKGTVNGKPVDIEITAKNVDSVDLPAILGNVV